MNPITGASARPAATLREPLTGTALPMAAPTTAAMAAMPPAIR